jgi:hypothetical protein
VALASKGDNATNEAAKSPIPTLNTRFLLTTFESQVTLPLFSVVEEQEHEQEEGNEVLG